MKRTLRPGRTAPRRIAVPFLLALSAALLVTPEPSSAQASSPSYRLAQSTLNGGGATAAGPNFRLTPSAGQESTIGVTSSTAHVLQTGFWSYLGSGLVPVVLFGKKNASNPEHPDLLWTGNNAPYVLYGTTNCPNVTSVFVATTPVKSYTDTAPPPGNLVCYSVFATAPGPIAPLGGIAPGLAGDIEQRR